MLLAKFLAHRLYPLIYDNLTYPWRNTQPQSENNFRPNVREKLVAKSEASVGARGTQPLCHSLPTPKQIAQRTQKTLTLPSPLE